MSSFLKMTVFLVCIQKKVDNVGLNENNNIVLLIFLLQILFVKIDIFYVIFEFLL